MSKEDYIDIIKAVEGVLKLEEACITLTGTGLDQGEGAAIYLLWEVLRRNAAEQFHSCRNINEDAERYEAFVEILCSKALTTEEKCKKLMQK